MRLIDTSQLNELLKEAKKSERLRSHLLMHGSHQDKVQRLLIAMVKGSYVEPHYHELSNQWEMFIVMQGQVKVNLYDDRGEVIKEYLAGEDTVISVVELAPGDIHSVECMSETAVMMEIKEGPFDPANAKSFPHS